MSFESQILAILAGDAGVNALMSSADVYFGTAPQNADAPFLHMQKTFTDPGATLDNGDSGTSRLDNIELQVTAYQSGYATANALALAVREALEGDRTMRFIMKDSFTSFDDQPDLHGQILLFSCWYNSTTS